MVAYYVELFKVSNKTDMLLVCIAAEFQSGFAALLVVMLMIQAKLP